MSHPTIRALTGASTTPSIDTGSTALLVIDFQNEYFSGKMPIPDGKAALENAKRLIEMADASDMPVFHIQHLTPSGAPIFAEGSSSADFHADLQPAANHAVVRKTSISVFPTTDIDAQRLDHAWLDLILERPRMNAVTLRDMVVSRHPRADV